MVPKWINYSAGAPVANDFTTTNAYGSPLCIDLSTSIPYYITAAGAITPISIGTVAFATTAGQLQTARNIAMTGDVTWNVNFDGSANVTAAGTIANAAVTLAKMANMATASLIYRKTAGAGAPEVNTLAQVKADMILAGNNSGDAYQTIFHASGSHTAGKVAGTYGFAPESALVVSGGGSLYPLALIYLTTADFPSINGITAPMLRVRANLHVNDVAPTGNFTFGLYPVTRPATSGGAGVCIYTIGALVTGSATTQITTPTADSSNQVVGSDFAFPGNGYYCFAVVTTATVAASSHLHMNCFLQHHY